MADAIIISTFKMCIFAVHVIFIDPRTLKHLTGAFLLRKLFASTDKNGSQPGQAYLQDSIDEFTNDSR